MSIEDILKIEDDAERRRLLIIRGWERQRAEATNESQRDFCDWMIQSAADLIALGGKAYL